MFRLLTVPTITVYGHKPTVHKANKSFLLTDHLAETTILACLYVNMMMPFLHKIHILSMQLLYMNKPRALLPVQFTDSRLVDYLSFRNIVHVVQFSYYLHKPHRA